ncbi:hypothetical protein MRX96_000625 [Rhipicephalus microplus]
MLQQMHRKVDGEKAEEAKRMSTQEESTCAERADVIASLGHRDEKVVTTACGDGWSMDKGSSTQNPHPSLFSLVSSEAALTTSASTMRLHLAPLGGATAARREVQKEGLTETRARTWEPSHLTTSQRTTRVRSQTCVPLAAFSSVCKLYTTRLYWGRTREL